jgi:hypothetical protein
MAITTHRQPDEIHSSGNKNWWVLSSNMYDAPRFTMKMEVKDGSSLYNTVLVPSDPDFYNPLNIQGIIDDYVPYDFNPTIIVATTSNTYKPYNILGTENFQGFWIFGTISTSAISSVTVLGNTTITEVQSGSYISNFGMINKIVTTADKYVIGYGTNSNGYVNSLSISQSPTASIGVSASVNGSAYGYLDVEGVTVYSTGATSSSAVKNAIKANIDWMEYNQSDNFDGYKFTNVNSKFLTNSPRELDIKLTEYHTLRLIQDYEAYPITDISITDSTGGVYFTTPISISDLVLDIPTGPRNISLSLTSSIKWYTVQMLSGTQSIGEIFRFNIDCKSRPDDMRLMWHNRLGGVDYYTFKYVDSKTTKVSRSTFDKNTNYNSTINDRGISTYKLDDYLEYSLTSDLVSDIDSEWLSEIFTSKEVYWLKDNTTMIPVTILSDSHIHSGWESREVKLSLRLSRSNFN